MLDNNNHLFVSNGNSNTIGEYDATTGAAINAAFITQGLDGPDGLVFATALPEPVSLPVAGRRRGFWWRLPEGGGAGQSACSACSETRMATALSTSWTRRFSAPRITPAR